MGKLPINGYKWPFSIAMSAITRGYSMVFSQFQTHQNIASTGDSPWHGSALRWPQRCWALCCSAGDWCGARGHGVDDGKMYRKALYLMVKTCKNPWFPVKIFPSIQWKMGEKLGLDQQEIHTKSAKIGTQPRTNGTSPTQIGTQSAKWGFSPAT